MISNICRANFNGGRTAQGNNRFQWDYGQILEISGIENLPDPFTAQFSNYPVLGTAKTTVGTGGRVEIPNEYFVSGQNIYCFIVLHTDEDDGRTVYIATIPVTKRPKPIDDPITPTQQSTIDTAIAALQAGVARAEEFAGDAEEQATIATGAATTATEAAETATGAVADVEAAATRAETAAEGAEASATEAEASATDAESAKTAALTAKDAAETAAASAEQSATDAGNYAGLAEEAETAAAESATAAKSSATSAAGSASAASGSATQAAQSASEASASATAANTSATNAEAAKTGAEAAQTAAETAQASAEEAAANAEQSAETAEWYAERVERFLPTDTASGEIASFPDGADSVPMQSVVVTMEPIQDLHGYDHPWPAGGGKNKFDPSIYSAYLQADGTFRGRAGEVNPVFTYIPASLLNTSVTFSATLDLRNSGTLTQCLVQAVVGGVSIDGSRISNGEVSVSAVTFTPTSETDYVHITFGSNGNNYFTFSQIQLESGSTATSWTPYSNECPISGRTGADIEHTGKNLFDFVDGNVFGPYRIIPFPAGAKQKVYMSLIDKDTSVDMSGISIGFVTTAFTSGRLTTDQYRWVFNNNNIKPNHSNTSGGVLIADGDILLDGVLIYPREAQALDKIRQRFDIQITVESTATDYEPYQGETLSVTFPAEAGTVYVGTLDVVSGDFVVDRAMVDLGTLDWGNGFGGFISQTLKNVIVNVSSNVDVPNIISSAYKTVPFANISDKSVSLVWSADPAYAYMNYIAVKDSAYTDAQTFKSAMSGVQLVYALAYPITYHLTPQEVRTLLGQNNIWSDAGTVTVQYKADIGLYIDKKLS